jgi:hypothetical protein
LAWRLSRDRVAQTVARMYLEPKVEPIVHPDSYGYRPGRLALDAVGACRERCWRADWFIDLDIKKFFVPYDLVLKAVAPTHLSRNRWRSETANSSTACTPADDRPPAVITACEWFRPWNVPPSYFRPASQSASTSSPTISLQPPNLPASYDHHHISNPDCNRSSRAFSDPVAMSGQVVVPRNVSRATLRPSLPYGPP